MDKVSKLIKSMGPQFTSYTFGTKGEEQTKFALSKHKTDATIEQWLPLHGELYTNDLDTFTIRAFTKGSKYKNAKGKSKRRKGNSVQLIPAPKMESL